MAPPLPITRHLSPARRRRWLPTIGRAGGAIGSKGIGGQDWRLRRRAFVNYGLETPSRKGRERFLAERERRRGRSRFRTNEALTPCEPG